MNAYNTIKQMKETYNFFIYKLHTLLGKKKPMYMGVYQSHMSKNEGNERNRH